MEERKPRADLAAAVFLTVCAAGGFLSLKLVGMICWILPIIGLLLPLMAAPFLWGGAALLAAGGILLCGIELRRAGAGQRWIFLLLMAVNGAVILLIALVSLYFFGLIPRSLSWLWNFCGDLGGWFLHMPSEFALM